MRERKKDAKPKMPDFKKMKLEIDDLIQREQQGKLTPAEKRKLSRNAKEHNLSLPDFLQTLRHLVEESAKPKPRLAEMPKIPTASDLKKKEQKERDADQYFRSLAGRARSGKLVKKEIAKLSHAAANDGAGIPAIGKKVFGEDAASRGQTLTQYVRCLLEINGFVKKTGKGFDSETMTVEPVAHLARFPRFALDALEAGSALTKEGKQVLLTIIGSQEREMAAQAAGRGVWPVATALEVAKLCVTHFDEAVRLVETVYADKKKERWMSITPCLIRTHEAASDLIKRKQFKSWKQMAHVDHACAWLREKRQGVLAHPPWDAPAGVHEGLELLRSAFGLSEKPPADAPAGPKAPARAKRKPCNKWPVLVLKHKIAVYKIWKSYNVWAKGRAVGRPTFIECWVESEDKLKPLNVTSAAHLKAVVKDRIEADRVAAAKEEDVKRRENTMLDPPAATWSKQD